jgi:hypothetical protein
MELSELVLQLLMMLLVLLRQPILNQEYKYE